jgi:predicted membrane-bound spermidine synthase
VWSFLGSFNHESADFKVNLALPALFALLAVSAIATLVTLLLPPLLLGARLPRERGVTLFLPYFLLLGAGYIIIQVGLIQKLILLLGHPTYALTVVVFSMLLSSGLGSFASRRILNRDEKRLRYVPLAVAAAVALLALLVTPASSALATAPAFVRLLCAVLMVAPAGFLMGMPFPGGLALLEEWQPMAVRWAWSMNAAASVLGSALSICCAIYIGLQNTLLLGALCYVAASLVLFMTARYRRLPDRVFSHAT